MSFLAGIVLGVIIYVVFRVIVESIISFRARRRDRL